MQIMRQIESIGSKWRKLDSHHQLIFKEKEMEKRKIFYLIFGFESEIC